MTASIATLAISLPAVGALGVGLSISLVAYAVLSQAEEKSVVRDSLRQLDGYEVDSARDQELMDPLLTRVLGPVGAVMNKLGRRFTPTGYVDNIRLKFIRGGFNNIDAVDRFMAIKVGMALLVPVLLWFTFIYNPLELKGLLQLAFFLIFGAAFIMGPDSWLNRRVDDRQKAILSNLPDVLDLLTISVEAGLGFEQALDRVIGAVPGPLSVEFARMLGETRAGASRADALRAMDNRIDVPEVRSFVMAILQADTFGVSIGRVLRAQAEEMRIKRRQLAQEKAMKAPVKMLIPMVFCIFPALFVIVLGPAMINISRNF